MDMTSSIRSTRTFAILFSKNVHPVLLGQAINTCILMSSSIPSEADALLLQKTPRVRLQDSNNLVNSSIHPSSPRPTRPPLLQQGRRLAGRQQSAATMHTAERLDCHSDYACNRPHANAEQVRSRI